MSVIIPLQRVPSQTLSVLVANQSCQINVYQRFYGVFFDLYADNVLVVGGVKCQNLNRLVRDKYLGFIGDFTFFDQQTDDNNLGTDPQYEGFGTRYLLLYLTPDEVTEALQ